VAVLQPVVDAPPLAGQHPHPSLVEPEVTTVADDLAVVFRGSDWKRYDDLEPATSYAYDGVDFTTLPRPDGERLSTVATVNDVHFGETICGFESSNPDGGPIYSSLPGERPYPEVMNEAAVEEIAALDPPADAVVVKGDLTDDGKQEDYDAFLRCYGGAFGMRMHHIRGNHDAYKGQTIAPAGPFVVDVAGARLAMLDTTVPFAPNGGVDDEQLEWLGDVAGGAGPTVLLFGHHQPWQPGSRTRPPTYSGINPDDSEKLVATVARLPRIAGYFCGHSHRNRVRRFAETGALPWTEVACVKDFPGAWAEYRIFEGGILQIVHRIRRADALVWTERTRGMFDGLYPQFSFGRLEDRCFELPASRG
jgi:3',5'-cyclic-AMP phosphodiesterase